MMSEVPTPQPKSTEGADTTAGGVEQVDQPATQKETSSASQPEARPSKKATTPSSGAEESGEESEAPLEDEKKKDEEAGKITVSYAQI